MTLIHISGNPLTYKLTSEVKKIILRKDGTAIIVSKSRNKWGVKGTVTQGPNGYIAGVNATTGEPFHFPTPQTSLDYARKHGIPIIKSRSKIKYNSPLTINL